MRLIEITQMPEEQPSAGRERLTDEEYELVYNKLMRHEMTKDQINSFASAMVDEGRYPRSVESLKFALSRMHILLHGIAPEGETQTRADTMFNISQPMIDYVLRRGDLDQEDLQLHTQNAKEELAQRPPPRQRVKKPEALQMMSDWARANREKLAPLAADRARANIAREQVIKDIMDGLSAEEAWMRHLQ